VDVEVLTIVPPDPSEADRTSRTAGLLQRRLIELGANVRRVTNVDDDVQLVTDEVCAVLRRGPSLLALVGGSDASTRGGLAAATDRAVAGRLPDGGAALDDDGLLMLVAGTQVVVLPADPEAFGRLWAGEVRGAIAEWLRLPPHSRGELVVLDIDLAVGEALVEAVAQQHPGVYLKVLGDPQAPRAVQVVALARATDESALRAVDAALADVERAATAARMQVSSSRRRPAHVAGDD
jgi:hypothetical protein